MSRRLRAGTPKETPIERIFEKVMGRKMTSQERVYFHLKPKAKAAPQVNANKQSRAA
jgi:hypothetical protein